ncbi:MAG: hypothetical protein M3Y65_09700 [Pseudomonadota bacterium]|nr:hypothetical protein [Pseudomonadota bacterium]
MKLFKHIEPVLMLAFFLLCALGSLQIGAPRHPVATMATIATIATIATNAGINTVTVSSAGDAGGQSADVRSASPASLPILVLMPTPMPVVHIVGRRMTAGEKRAGAASAG